MANGMAPWIQPADPATHFIRAYTAGASVAESRNRLAVAQMEEDRRALEAQQRIEVARAEQQQRTDLEMQKLAQDEVKLGIQASNAAQRFQAQQMYQRRVAAGEDPGAVITSLGPQLGPGWQSGVIGAQRLAQQAERTIVPESVRARPVLDESGKPIPGMDLVPSSTGWRVTTRPGYVGEQAGERTERFHRTQNRIAKLKADKTDILKAWGSMGLPLKEPKNPDAALRWRADKARLANINTEMEGLAPAVSEETAKPKAKGRKAAPPVGTIVRGYRFLGGDPSSPTNWEEVEDTSK